MKPLLTVEDVAEIVGVHRETVRRWIRRGDLVGVYLGNRAGYRISESDLRAYLCTRQMADGPNRVPLRPRSMPQNRREFMQFLHRILTPDEYDALRMSRGRRGVGEAIPGRIRTRRVRARRKVFEHIRLLHWDLMILNGRLGRRWLKRYIPKDITVDEFDRLGVPPRDEAMSHYDYPETWRDDVI